MSAAPSSPPPTPTAESVLQRFAHDADFGRAYRAQGYVVLTDLFDPARLETARDQVLQLFRRGLGEAVADVPDEDLLVSGQARHPDRWRSCARRMLDLPAIHGLAVGERLERASSELGLREPLISTRPEVRTDMPDGERYLQPWHQDWRFGQGSLNSVTIWIPLHDVGVENGTIELIPGSHLLGYLEAEEVPNPRRFRIVDERIDELPRMPAEIRLGEAIVFSQLLIHRSGQNTSGRPRLTAQVRLADAAEPRFAAEGFPTPSGSELVWSRPPSRAEAAAAFSEPG